jgi:hypothetical protein
MLTAKDVRKRVAHIKKIMGDDESAHSEEDGLYGEVLAAIAGGTCEDPAACAREAIKTADLNFNRWCA